LPRDAASAVPKLLLTQIIFPACEKSQEDAVNKYLVVSYCDDQQEWFYDTVLAGDRTEAQEFICKLRSYVRGAEASEENDFPAKYVTVKINETEWDAREALSQCQNCYGVFPDSRLVLPIKDLAKRVAAGEPTPSGECPECGALCHFMADEVTHGRDGLVLHEDETYQGWVITCHCGQKFADEGDLEKHVAEHVAEKGS
jgi:hypothetical protein